MSTFVTFVTNCIGRYVYRLGSVISPIQAVMFTKCSAQHLESCDDDARFVVLCARFGGDCEGNGGLAKSLQKYCKKTCSLCCK